MNNKETKIKIRVIKKTRTRKTNKENNFFLFYPLGKSLVKITAVLVIIVLNWTGLSAVLQTFSFFNNTENSADNNFTAGTLDFELNSPADFYPVAISAGEVATRTISVVNLDNTPKYTVTATSSVGALCDYLTLEANLDGDGVEYTGKLTDFTYGPVVFEEPDNWLFTLTLPADAPENVIGETCNFNFVFFGSQIKNDLPFGQGFNDIEEIGNNIASKYCYNSETRSKGYWKNHPDVYKPYLPQTMGNEIIGSVSDVNQVFDDYSSSMRNRLKGQLLGMKFNVAHYGVGDYFVATTSQTINQIVEEADNLLKQNPPPSDEVLEDMKDLLESLVDLQLRVCTVSDVKVIIPNGGEIWWVGGNYDLTWTTKNLNCPNDSIVSIWYSKDSGATWGNIATSTENDGIYNWRISLFLEGGTYYVPSHNARIKVVTRCSENLLVNGWDMSDADFCPPIDFELLTEEEKAQVEQLLADGILTEADIINREVITAEGTDEGSGAVENPIITDDSTTTEDVAMTTEEVATTTDGTATSTEEVATTTDDTATSTEEVSTTTDEASTTTENQEGGIISEIISEIDEAIDGIVNGIVEEIMPGGTTNGEPTVEGETPTIDETAVIEEAPTVEEPVIEGVPATEEQPVVAPENTVIEGAAPEVNGGDGTTVGDGSVGSTGGEVDGGDIGSNGEATI